VETYILLGKNGTLDGSSICGQQPNNLALIKMKKALSGEPKAFAIINLYF